MVNDERNQWICQRAYALWEIDGRPDGRSHDHWCQAVVERSLMEKTRASPDGREIILRFRQRTSQTVFGMVEDISRKVA